MRYAAATVDDATLERLGPEPDGLELSDVLAAGIDLDKYWNAVQVLLGGSQEAQEPLFTGIPFGEVGYGPAWLALPDEVARVAATFEALTEEELVARVDVQAMHDQAVYPPPIWLREPADELAESVGSAAWELVKLYREAARQNLSILAALD